MVLTFVEVVCTHSGSKYGVHSVALLTGQQFFGQFGVQYSWSGCALAEDNLHGHQSAGGSSHIIRKHATAITNIQKLQRNYTVHFLRL